MKKLISRDEVRELLQFPIGNLFGDDLEKIVDKYYNKLKATPIEETLDEVKDFIESEKKKLKIND